MVSHINLNKQDNLYNNLSLNKKDLNQTPYFKGRGMLGLVQKCEKQPMINVALIDLITAIIPRTIIESFRNIFAGFEAFRRESSGLIINCLIPGFITLGYAKLINNNIMGKNKSDMSSCWADSKTLRHVTKQYKNSESTEAFKAGMKIFNNEKHARVYAVNYNLLNEASGLDGNAHKSFKDVLSKKDISSQAENLTRSLFESKDGKLTEEVVKKVPKKRLKAIYHALTKKTHIAQNVKFADGMVSNLDKAINDTHKILGGMVKENLKPSQADDFLNRSMKLLKRKSLLGILTILPLAASMQYINRKITEKSSGVKGAPIHEDYGQKTNIVKSEDEIKKEKKSLLKEKIGAVTMMLSVAMLSMMKLPTKNTLKDIVQFKNHFPTMDQARAISAVTFSSRMATADDKAELKESKWRDIITFSSMYFLGDYGGKIAATRIQKKQGIELLNKDFNPENNKTFLSKIKNWVVNTHIKSSDELKGTGEILEKAKNARAKAQLANLGTSLLLLGVFVPLYTTYKTKKHDREEKERYKLQQSKVTQNNYTHFTGTQISKYNSKFNSLQAFKTSMRTKK